MARPPQHNLAAPARVDGKPNPAYERRRRAIKSITDGAVTTLLTSDTAEADARTVADALAEAGYKIAVLCDGNNWRLVVTTRPQQESGVPLVPNKMDCFSPACPICGGDLRKWNRPRGVRSGRSHSFFAKPQLWICPAAEAEIVKDERGHLSVIANAKHEKPSRLWSDEELVRVAAEKSAKRESERIARGEDECPF